MLGASSSRPSRGGSRRRAGDRAAILSAQSKTSSARAVMSGAMAPRREPLPIRYRVPLAPSSSSMSSSWPGPGQQSATTASWLRQASALAT